MNNLVNNLDNLLDSCREIINIPSESGNEKKAASYLAKLMKKLGYDRVWIDRYGNAVGIIIGNGGKTVLLQGHLDTVGVEDPSLWQVDPYAGIIKDGRLYGRGASDMKAALLAMIYAAAAFIPHKDTLNVNIAVAGVVHEEDFEGVAQGEVLDQVKPNLVILGEASQLKLCIGQKGRAELELITYGKSAHSARPESGLNAVTMMIKVLQEIEKLELPEDKFLGKAILELTDIHSFPYPGRSVIPEKCTTTFDRRLLPGETESSVLEPVLEIFAKIKNQDQCFQGTVRIVEAEAKCYTGEKIAGKRFFPGWIFSEDSPFIQGPVRELKKKGIELELSSYSFCTDGSQSAGVRGIPTVGFGPSHENLAHIVDEYIELDQLEKAYQVYQLLIKSFSRGNYHG